MGRRMNGTRTEREKGRTVEESVGLNYSSLLYKMNKMLEKKSKKEKKTPVLCYLSGV